MQSEIVFQHLGPKLIQWASFGLSNILTIILSFIILAISYLVYKVAFVPINRIKDYSDIGFKQFKDAAVKRKINFKSHINEIKRLKQLGQLPPIIPNGWYVILESDDLAPGDAKSVSAIGKTFAVFRSLEGEAYVVDGYCSHLGANLGLGGQVKGSCIECPFHGWQFDGKSGECTLVPNSEKVPAQSKIKKWPSVEQTGWILIWFHAEGDEPSWYPPDIKEIANGEWVCRGRSENIISAHIQDISENGADLGHFAQVHTPNMMAGNDVKHTRARIWSFAEHVWNASWQDQEAPETHIAKITITHSMKLFDKISLFTADVAGTQVGPSIAYLRMSFAGLNGVFIQTATPISPTDILLVHRFYCPKSISTLYCNLIILGEILMFERDVSLWNNKTYVAKPLLVKEDKSLARHRKWFTQFYSENSPRYTTVKETLSW